MRNEVIMVFENEGEYDKFCAVFDSRETAESFIMLKDDSSKFWIVTAEKIKMEDLVHV